MINWLKRRIKEVGRNIVYEGIDMYLRSSEYYSSTKNSGLFCPSTASSAKNMSSSGIVSQVVFSANDYVNQVCTDINVRWNYSFALDVMANAEKYEAMYGMLEDKLSREILLSIIKYRMTAFVQETLPSHPPSTPHNYELNPDSLPKLHDERGQSVYYRSQYAIPGIFKAEKGSTVIDGGAWVGDSAIYFANQVGIEGKVYAFEANPKIADALRKNLIANNVSNVDVIMLGLSDIPKEALIGNNGPGSWIQAIDLGSAEDNSGKFFKMSLIDLDSYANQNNIAKVGMIKLDIEGSEREAISGSKQVILRDKPKLAISIYHKPDDFHVIPEIITAIRDDYKFYIRHAGDDLCETVLFAI